MHCEHVRIAGGSTEVAGGDAQFVSGGAAAIIWRSRAARLTQLGRSAYRPDRGLSGLSGSSGNGLEGGDIQE